MDLRCGTNALTICFSDKKALVLLACLAPFGFACGSSDRSEQPQVAPIDSPSAPPSRPRIVILGDSLTAGFGIAPDEAYPALLQRKLDAKGYRFEVVNAGVSADTSAGGMRRLDWALAGDVRVLVIALGANDGLRGLAVADMQRNLSTIIQRAQARGIAVLLTGLEAPPNFGGGYASEFRQAYRDLAKEHEVAFLPFLLEGVAGHPEFNQGDGVHPNREGARRVAEHVWTTLEPLLAPATAGSDVR